MCFFIVPLQQKDGFIKWIDNVWLQRNSSCVTIYWEHRYPCIVHVKICSLLCFHSALQLRNEHIDHWSFFIIILLGVCMCVCVTVFFYLLVLKQLQLIHLLLRQTQFGGKCMCSHSWWVIVTLHSRFCETEHQPIFSFLYSNYCLLCTIAD